MFLLEWSIKIFVCSTQAKLALKLFAFPPKHLKLLLLIMISRLILTAFSIIFDISIRSTVNIWVNFGLLKITVFLINLNFFSHIFYVLHYFFQFLINCIDCIEVYLVLKNLKQFCKLFIIDLIFLFTIFLVLYSFNKLRFSLFFLHSVHILCPCFLLFFICFYLLFKIDNSLG